MWQSRVVLILSIIGMGICATFFGGRISHTLFYMTLVIPLAALIYIVYVYINVRYVQSVGKRKIVKGEPASYEMLMRNETQIAFSSIRFVYFEDKSRLFNVDKDREYYLAPGSSHTVSTEIVAKYRGEYLVGAKAFVITDPFGIFRVECDIHSKMSVTVLPRIVEWTNTDIICDEEDEKKTVFQPDSRELDICVREYVKGDVLKKVHWKVSARTGKMFVRLDNGTEKGGVLLLPDFSPVRAEGDQRIAVEDSLIEQLLAMSSYCIGKKIPCRVTYFQNGIQECRLRNESDFDAFYESCATLYFTQDSPYNLLLSQRTVHISGNDTIVMITHQMTQDVYSKIIELYHQGRTVRVVFVATGHDPEEEKILKLLGEKGITVFLTAGEGVSYGNR